MGLLAGRQASGTWLTPIPMYGLFVAPAMLAAHPKVALIMALGILGMSVGALFVNLLMNVRVRRRLKHFRRSELMLGFKSRKHFLCAFWSLNALVLAGSAYYFGSVGIALFADEVGLARLTERHAVSGSYFFQRLFRVLGPVLLFIYLCSRNVRETAHSYKIWIYSILLLMIASFLVFTGLRGNLITFLFTPLVILLALKDEAFNVRVGLTYFSLALAAGILITNLMYGGVGIFQALILILGRLSGAATDGIGYAVLYDIPQNGFRGLEVMYADILSIFSKLGLYSGKVSNYSAYIAEQLLGERYNGEAAAVYLSGELYASAGFLSLLIGSFLTGIFIQTLYLLLICGPKTILRISFGCYGLGVLVTILGGPTTSMLIDYSITLSAFIFIFIFLVSTRSFSK